MSLILLAGDKIAPREFKEFLVPYHPTKTLQSAAGLLVTPRISKSRMGGRAFSYYAPLLLNHLPILVQEADTISAVLQYSIDVFFFFS